MVTEVVKVWFTDFFLHKYSVTKYIQMRDYGSCRKLSDCGTHLPTRARNATGGDCANLTG